MSNRRRQIDINNIFIEVYRAFPANIMGRDEIDPTNNVILPPSALKKLSCMKNFGDTKNPILFRILNIQLNIYTHCGVFDFTAEEGTCYLPANMFDRLCLEEGQKVNIRALKIAPGTFIKIQPHKTEFMNNPQAKSILKYNLNTNYFCVTEGDTISVKLGDEYYKLDILECKPNKGIRIINSSNLIIDFAPPKDYKEPEHKKANKNVIEANIKEKEEKNQDIHINNEEEGPKGNIELKINEIEKNIKEKNDNLLRNENEKINKLLNENEKFREEVLNLNKKISQLENSIKKLNTENSSLNKNNINYTKEIEQLKTDNSNLLDKLKYLSNIQNNNNREILLMKKLEKKIMR